MARHDDLAHAEIARAYEAYTSEGGASGADRIIIVLDLMIHRINDMSGNGNGRWGRVKKQGPVALGGLGLGAFLLRVLEAVV